MTAPLLTGLAGVGLTERGTRAWWSAADPDRPGRSRVYSVTMDGSAPRPETTRRDGTAYLHGYPGRGWLAGESALIWPNDSVPAGDGVVLAEPCRVGNRVVAVREQPWSPRRSLVVLHPRSGTTSPLWAGSDFMGGLESAPGGRSLSWLAWDNPDMPWDGARLMVGELVGGHLRDVRAVAGGPHGSAQPAAWTGPSSLLTSTEDSGRWQPREILAATGQVVGRWSHPEEVGLPYWRAGTRTFVATTAGCCALAGGRLWRVGPDHLEPVDPDGYWSSWLAGGDHYVLGLRETADTLPALTRIDLVDGRCRRLYPGSGPEVACMRRMPDVIRVDGDACVITVRLYAPGGSAPWPTVLVVHGGPTLTSPTLLDPALQWIVDAGFAVAVVDYSGSAGHGRAFRNALNGRWGKLEVTDCERAARRLIGRGVSDRVAIRGVSSGGWTVLHALVDPDCVFAAGVAFAPVTDVSAARRETPDFEKCYVDRLMGPFDRSPSRQIERVRRPLLVVQGERDQVVRPATTQRYVRGARDLGASIEYLPLPDEGHLISGHRAIARAKAAELALYRRELTGHER